MIRRLVLVAALALAAPQMAAAHAILVDTAPANGAVLARAPAVATVTFDSTVHVGSQNAAVRADGQTILAGRPEVERGRTLVVRLRPRLTRGDYTVRWSVVSEDGHEQEGVIVFAVGKGSPKPVAALTVHGFEAWQRVVMRTLFFLGALGSAGVTFFSLFVLVPLGLERKLRRRQAHALFGFFLLGFCGSDALVHTADAAGTRFERFVIVAAVAAGIGAVAAALTPLYGRLRHVAVGAAGLLVVCPTFAGHALDASQPRFLAPAADLLHIAGAAVWFGGLASLCATAGQVGAAARIDLIRRFSSLAVAAVGVLAVAGTSRALTELGSVSQLWSTGYGRALLVKSGAFAGAIGVAWLARSALTRSETPAKGLFPVELALLVALVVAVATLTDLQPGSARSGDRLLGARALAGIAAPLPVAEGLPLDDLQEARRVLERGEPGRCISRSARRAPQPPRCCDRSRRAEEAAECK